MLPCQLCSTITKQELFKKHPCNQSSHYEKYRRFPLQRKPSHTTTKLTPFAVSKDEWDTKEDTGKCTYCGMPKGMCPAEVTSNSEKVKLVALVVIELR